MARDLSTSTASLASPSSFRQRKKKKRLPPAASVTGSCADFHFLREAERSRRICPDALPGGLSGGPHLTTPIAKGNQQRHLERREKDFLSSPSCAYSWIEEPFLSCRMFFSTGNTSVGKTCMLSRFARDHFLPQQRPTLGVDYETRTLQIDSKKVKIQVWDTAGHERFRSVTSGKNKQNTQPRHLASCPNSLLTSLSFFLSWSLSLLRSVFFIARALRVFPVPGLNRTKTKDQGQT